MENLLTGSMTKSLGHRSKRDAFLLQNLPIKNGVNPNHLAPTAFRARPTVRKASDALGFSFDITSTRFLSIPSCTKFLAACKSMTLAVLKFWGPYVRSIS